MEIIIGVVIGVVVLGLIGLGVWVYLRQRWIKEFEAKGRRHDRRGAADRGPYPPQG